MHILVQALVVVSAVAHSALALPPPIQERAPSEASVPWSHARLAQKPKLATVDEKNQVNDPTGAKAQIPKRVTTRDWKFSRDAAWGQGVLVYVVDSGVRKSHEEFSGGNVEDGHVLPTIKDGRKATYDALGHGTQVASLVAGKTLGIAPSSTIVPIRVVSADTNHQYHSPPTVDGINLAIEDYQKRSPKPKGAIIVLAMTHYRQLPGAQSVVKKAIDAGIHFVLAAGNENRDACQEDAGGMFRTWMIDDVGQFTVGATDWADRRWSNRRYGMDFKLLGGSNFGECLTSFAPGSSMIMADGKCANEGPDDKCDKSYTPGGLMSSGTSFAAALHAGVLSMLISSEGNKSPKDMRDFVLDKMTSSVTIEEAFGAPQRVLQLPSQFLSSENQ